MPELPEVETIRRGLDHSVIGQQFSHVHVILPKTVIGDISRILHKPIISAQRRGKLLIISLGDSFLLIHLKMTGQLIFQSQRLPGFGGGHPVPPLNTTLPNKSTRVIFTFQSGDVLFFNDIRTFGYIKVVPADDINGDLFLQKVGVEPLSEDFTVAVFNTLLAKSPKVVIKAFLLDQARIAGLGNIYCDEALYLARILPTRLTGSLDSEEKLELFRAIREVLERGIQYHGSSSSSYVALDGSKGTYLSKVLVYKQQGKQCQRCGGMIKKIKVAGRGTHLCFGCQK